MVNVVVLVSTLLIYFISWMEIPAPRVIAFTWQNFVVCVSFLSKSSDFKNEYFLKTDLSAMITG